jgi:hypothetical protein
MTFGHAFNRNIDKLPKSLKVVKIKN